MVRDPGRGLPGETRGSGTERDDRSLRFLESGEREEVLSEGMLQARERAQGHCDDCDDERVSEMAMDVGDLSVWAVESL